MIISLIIILIITFGGLSLTYLFADKETFLWRLATGNIVGSALFGLVAFLLANFLGLSIVTVLIALLIAVSPILLLRDKKRKRQFKDEWQWAKDKTQGTSLKKLWKLAYYLFFLGVFLAFFDRAMIVGSDGIFTGGSQNLGDLPYHLGAIFSFTDGNNFPPQNPSFADAKFTYPFIADFLTACLMKLGASVQSAMFLQNVSWAFSLLVILEWFVAKVTNNRLAGKIAPFILFFSGGLGYLWFLKDFWYGTQSLWEILWNLPKDYTIDEKFRWGNSMVVLFLTQRSLLLGLPLTLIVLGKLFQVKELRSWGVEEKRKENSFTPALLYSFTPAFAVGLIAGTLPLIHAHSLAVLFIVSAFWFFFSLENWKQWMAFAVGVSVIAIPELLWIMAGSATKTSEFIAWHYGWDSRGVNLVKFWLKNAGLFIPLLAASLIWIFTRKGEKKKEGTGEQENERTGEKEDLLHKNKKISPTPLFPYSLSIFAVPFIFIFVVSNVAKFAPWEWDNIKVLIYWFVGSIPLVALFLAWLWQKNTILKALAIGCILVLTISGALDVWRTASAQMRHGVFDADAVKIAEDIKLRTEPNALFLNAPTYNSAIVLTGRRSLMRYSGHLSSHGIDYKPREDDLKKIYAGEATADILLKKYGIQYVLISPKEHETSPVNEQFFQKFPVIAEQGQYKVFEVK